MPVLFTADAHAGLLEGSITRTFRRWKRAQVRPGGRYRVGGLLLVVDDVRRVRAGDLTEGDAVAAGEPDLAALIGRLAGCGEPPEAEELLWRVDLHHVGPDDRIALRSDADLSLGDVEALRTRLDRLDRASPYGPWTRVVLRLIAERPGVVSNVLAEELGRDRARFKADVRKLKALGLTENLDIGYRLKRRELK